jgi:hypothetical protein
VNPRLTRGKQICWYIVTLRRSVGRILRIPDEEDIKVEVEEEIEHTATGGYESDHKESRSFGIGSSSIRKDGDEEPRQRALVDFFLWPKNMSP